MTPNYLVGQIILGIWTTDVLRFGDWTDGDDQRKHTPFPTISDGATIASVWKYNVAPRRKNKVAFEAIEVRKCPLHILVGSVYLGGRKHPPTHPTHLGGGVTFFRFKKKYGVQQFLVLRSRKTEGSSFWGYRRVNQLQTPYLEGLSAPKTLRNFPR